MEWEQVTPPSPLPKSYYCLLISAVQPRLYLLLCFIQLVSTACIQLESSEPTFILYPFAFVFLHKIQAVTVTNVWWLCPLAKEYTDIRLFNESCSCASHTVAAGSLDFKGFIGTGPYALVVQMLALAVLHTGMRMLISYTGSCVFALVEIRNNRTDHCKTELFTFKKTSFF